MVQGAPKRSPMPRVETIKGLERGLRVLQVLQSQPIVSLRDIYVATAISKPSLLRISQYSGTGGPRYSSPGRRPLSAQHLLRPGA